MAAQKTQGTAGESGHEARDEIFSAIAAALRASGITEEYLATKLKRELNAKTTTRVKVKGAVNPLNVTRGAKIVTTSGVIVRDKDDGDFYGTGDTVLEWDEVDWTTRQKARIDAHKLLNHYPAEKHEVEILKPLVVFDDE